MSNNKKAGQKANRYKQIIAHVFNKYYKPGATEFEFARTDFAEAASHLGVDQVDNLGDLIYSFRFRSALPEEITRTATDGKEWIIRLAGRAKYRFVLSKMNRIQPRPDAFQIKIPDATPQIVTRHSGGDEQALLTKVRYNRLIDTFLRVTAYHLQSHLRTTVTDMGQIETDDVYVAVRNTGQQFVIPVQAKGGTDEIGVVQVEQDLALCKQTFPDLEAASDLFRDPWNPSWNTKDAVAVAAAMYETRDFTPAPILADALEDAGCADAKVLAELRADSPALFRGCYVLDMVLGKRG